MAARRRAPAKDTPTAGEQAAQSTGSAAQSTGSAAGSSSAGDRYERIRQRAYELWEHEGRPQGRDREHWEQAEREVDAGAEGSSSSSASAAPRAAESSSSEDGGQADAAADLGDGAPGAATRRRRRPTTGGA